MMIAKDDEIKRNKLWRGAMIGSSVVIIIIALFFITKLFMGNPLEGSWVSEDNNLTLKIRSNNSMVVNVPEILENSNVELKMNYIIDKEEKTLTIEEDIEALQKAVKASDGQFTQETLENALSSITTTFDYSVDHQKLTLTEREYGEQMVFTKQ